MSSSKPYLQEWHHKLFIREMEAKGKLERHITEAKERHVSCTRVHASASCVWNAGCRAINLLLAAHLQEKVYHETSDRVFPGPLGKEAVLDRLVKGAEQQIEASKKKHPDAVGVTFVEPVPGASKTSMPKPKSQRHEIKVRACTPCWVGMPLHTRAGRAAAQAVTACAHAALHGGNVVAAIHVHGRHNLPGLVHAAPHLTNTHECLCVCVRVRALTCAEQAGGDGA